MDDASRDVAGSRALIDRLSAAAVPVRPIASPLHRTALWLLACGVLVAIVVAVVGPRAGLLDVLTRPSALLQFVGSVLTGAAAAYAAFQVSVPGRAPAWAWLPVLPVSLWLAAMGWGCLADYASLGLGAFAVQTQSGECARAIVLMSLPMALAMVLMVRHAGVVRPGATALLAALSASALCSAGVSLIHSGETMLMTLLWHFGAVAVLSLASLAMGRRLFGWVGHARQRSARAA